MVQPLMHEVGGKRTGIHRGGLPQKYFLDGQGRRLILERYDGKSETLNELMHYFAPLGIPRYKVRHWAAELGLSRQKEPAWTSEEIAYLEKNLHKQSLGDIGKRLGRTKTAIRIKAKRIGINKCYQEGYTMRGLCIGLGCDHHKVKKWLDLGWLKGHKRKTERTQRDIWYFSEMAIRKFIKEHPQEIDPRRADWLWLVDILVGLGPLISVEEEA